MHLDDLESVEDLGEFVIDGRLDAHPLAIRSESLVRALPRRAVAVDSHEPGVRARSQQCFGVATEPQGGIDQDAAGLLQGRRQHLRHPIEQDGHVPVFGQCSRAHGRCFRVVVGRWGVVVLRVQGGYAVGRWFLVPIRRPRSGGSRAGRTAGGQESPHSEQDDPLLVEVIERGIAVGVDLGESGRIPHFEVVPLANHDALFVEACEVP